MCQLSLNLDFLTLLITEDWSFHRTTRMKVAVSVAASSCCVMYFSCLQVGQWQCSGELKCIFLNKNILQIQSAVHIYYHEYNYQITKVHAELYWWLGQSLMNSKPFHSTFEKSGRKIPISYPSHVLVTDIVFLCSLVVKYSVFSIYPDSESARNPCPRGWLNVGTDPRTAQCFKLYPNAKKNFNAASDYCKSQGGYIATDTS